MHEHAWQRKSLWQLGTHSADSGTALRRPHSYVPERGGGSTSLHCMGGIRPPASPPRLAGIWLHALARPPAAPASVYSVTGARSCTARKQRQPREGRTSHSHCLAHGQELVGVWSDPGRGPRPRLLSKPCGGIQGTRSLRALAEPGSRTLSCCSASSTCLPAPASSAYSQLRGCARRRAAAALPAPQAPASALAKEIITAAIHHAQIMHLDAATLSSRDHEKALTRRTKQAVVPLLRGSLMPINSNGNLCVEKGPLVRPSAYETREWLHRQQTLHRSSFHPWGPGTAARAPRLARYVAAPPALCPAARTAPVRHTASATFPAIATFGLRPSLSPSERLQAALRARTLAQNHACHFIRLQELHASYSDVQCCRQASITLGGATIVPPQPRSNSGPNERRKTSAALTAPAVILA